MFCILLIKSKYQRLLGEAEIISINGVLFLMVQGKLQMFSRFRGGSRQI
jgi:hypothetical protein